MSSEDQYNTELLPLHHHVISSTRSTKIYNTNNTNRSVSL